MRVRQLQSRRPVILGPNGKPARSVRARYDAAQTTTLNSRHWASADALSADAAASISVRRTLRNRSRYEIANNSYARGIVNLLADYTIGTGPRLQVLSESQAESRQVEAAFFAWARAVRLPEKLRVMRKARTSDGENFALLATNPAIANPVRLDIIPIEADRIADPLVALESDSVDGITFDAHRNPVTYSLLNEHPGGQFSGFANNATIVPADQIIHGFRPDRPGQSRGVPEITPALPLFAQLRRYTLAVLTAAESAANISGVLKTTAPPDEAIDPESGNPFETIEMERNMFTVMPDGYDITQIKAEQPTTMYPDFKREIINEIARALNIPYNIAAGNSSGYNYASGRLDHQAFFRSIAVDQAIIEAQEVNRIFAAWYSEAILIEGLLPQRWRLTGATIPHQWFWDGTEHVDPAKEAKGQATRLASGATNLAREYGRLGLDWETELRQRASELALMRELEIPVAGLPAPEPAEAGDLDNE